MEFKDLLGKTLISVKGEKGDDEIIFKTSDGKKYKLYHWQNCCENVTVEDICGDLNDLIGSPLVEAEEATSEKNPEGVEKNSQDSFIWTFYKLRTIKGCVTIRWYGESNGYYSESVDFEQVV